MNNLIFSNFMFLHVCFYNSHILWNDILKIFRNIHFFVKCYSQLSELIKTDNFGNRCFRINRLIFSKINNFIFFFIPWIPINQISLISNCIGIFRVNFFIIWFPVNNFILRYWYVFLILVQINPEPIRVWLRSIFIFIW